jgi:hypothetical protein
VAAGAPKAVAAVEIPKTHAEGRERLLHLYAEATELPQRRRRWDLTEAERNFEAELGGLCHPTQKVNQGWP